MQPSSSNTADHQAAQSGNDFRYPGSPSSSADSRADTNPPVSGPTFRGSTLNSNQMGQGASTPRDEARSSRREASASAAPQQQPEMQQIPGVQSLFRQQEEEERANNAARLRRSRRLRNHFEHLSRLGNRLMSSSSSTSSGSRGLLDTPSSASTTSNTSATRSRISSGLRFRSRYRGGSRSPSPLSGGPRNERRRTMPPISRPIPFNENMFGGSMVDQGADMMDISPTSTVTPPPPQQQPPRTDPSSIRRRSRISRVRDSISSWPDIVSSGLGARVSRPSSRRPSESNRTSVPDALLDRAPHDMDIDTPTTASAPTEPTTTTNISANNDTGPAGRERPSLFGPNFLDGLDNPARVRPGEDQAAMLSRLLSVAAATTAASLVGGAEQAITEAQDVAGDNGGDGSFESFLRALQNGRLEAALRNGGNEMGGGSPTDSNNDNGMLSLNFFRMFRFGSQPAQNSDGEGQGDRMVPVIIVGIRSVTPRDTGETEGTDRPTFFDALANIPLMVPSIQRRSRLNPTHRRTTSLGSGTGQASTNASTANPPRRFSTTAAQGDTPTGPNPPPSTPADPTATTFPNPFPSRANRRSADGYTVDLLNGRDDEGLSTGFRERRESFRRRLPRRLSSPEPPSPFGLPPRAGTRENSRSTGSRRSPPASAEGTRSWIIYVLGGSYPENHPILTTPSLFTDEPTYEDMTLLSSLLGPAKPPVAAQDDVAAAGGVFKFGGPETPSEINSERCLVCLSDYEPEQECRQLTKCKHVFHRECIDEWLTTGRNSCPLCRGEGVEEKSKASSAAEGVSAS